MRWILFLGFLLLINPVFADACNNETDCQAMLQNYRDNAPPYGVAARPSLACSIVGEVVEQLGPKIVGEQYGVDIIQEAVILEVLQVYDLSEPDNTRKYKCDVLIGNQYKTALSEELPSEGYVKGKVIMGPYLPDAFNGDYDVSFLFLSYPEYLASEVTPQESPYGKPISKMGACYVEGRVSNTKPVFHSTYDTIKNLPSHYTAKLTATRTEVLKNLAPCQETMDILLDGNSKNLTNQTIRAVLDETRNGKYYLSKSNVIEQVPVGLMLEETSNENPEPEDVPVEVEDEPPVQLHVQDKEPALKKEAQRGFRRFIGFFRCLFGGCEVTSQ